MALGAKKMRQKNSKYVSLNELNVIMYERDHVASAWSQGTSFAIQNIPSQTEK
jgi:hypothetical protein